MKEIKAYINGIASGFVIQDGSLSISRAVNTITSASLSLLDFTHVITRINKFTEIDIREGSKSIYKGYVTDSSTKYDRGIYVHSVNLIGRETIFENILIQSDYSDDIDNSGGISMSKLFTKISDDNSISPLSSIVCDINDVVYEGSYQLISLYDILNSLADEYSLFWILKNNTLYINKMGGTTSSATLTDDDVLNKDLDINVDNSKECNTVYFSEAYTLSSKTYKRKGDADTRTFELPKKLYHKPTVRVYRDVNSVSGGWEEEPVGNADKEDTSNTYKWYWSKYDNTIVQNSNEDVLVSSDMVEFTGDFLTPYTKKIENDTLVATTLANSNGAIRNITNVYDSSIVVGINNIKNKATRLTKALSKDTITVRGTFNSRAASIDIGDIVTFTSQIHLISGLFVVSSLTRTVLIDGSSEYEIEMTNTNGVIQPKVRDVVKDKIRKQAIQSGGLKANSSKYASGYNPSSSFGSNGLSLGKSEQILVFDLRTSDPDNPVNGQTWIRTDLLK